MPLGQIFRAPTKYEMPHNCTNMPGNLSKPS